MMFELRDVFLAQSVHWSRGRNRMLWPEESTSVIVKMSSSAGYIFFDMHCVWRDSIVFGFLCAIMQHTCVGKRHILHDHVDVLH